MADPYGSHLPPLKMLSKMVPMRRVLEFGMGRHSTPFFLSKAKRLVSVESDPKWARGFLDPTDFDLVFIDDGREPSERVETIRWVLGQDHPPVVIHDAEVPAYAALLEGIDHTLYDKRTPHTAVVW